MCFIVSSRRSNAALPSSGEAPSTGAADSAVIPAIRTRTPRHLCMFAHSEWCLEQTSTADRLFRVSDGSGINRRCDRSGSASHTYANQEDKMADRDQKELSSAANLNRRGLLKCMSWAGTGVLWTLSGGVPRSLGLLGEAAAAEPQASGLTFLQISDSKNVRPLACGSASGLTFLQISDSHVGFDKPANPNALGT